MARCTYFHLCNSPQHNASSLYQPLLLNLFVIFIPVLAVLFPFSDDITCTIIHLVAFCSFARVARSAPNLTFMNSLMFKFNNNNMANVKGDTLPTLVTSIAGLMPIHKNTLELSRSTVDQMWSIISTRIGFNSNVICCTYICLCICVSVCVFYSSACLCQYLTALVLNCRCLCFQRRWPSTPTTRLHTSSSWLSTIHTISHWNTKVCTELQLTLIAFPLCRQTMLIAIFLVCLCVIWKIFSVRCLLYVVYNSFIWQPDLNWNLGFLPKTYC